MENAAAKVENLIETSDDNARAEKEKLCNPLSPNLFWDKFWTCAVAKTNLSNTIRPSPFFGFCNFWKIPTFVARQTLASSIMFPNGKLSKSWVNTDGILGFLSIKIRTVKTEMTRNIHDNLFMFPNAESLVIMDGISMSVLTSKQECQVFIFEPIQTMIQL